MILTNRQDKRDTLWTTLQADYRTDETTCLERLIPLATLPPASITRIQTTAAKLVEETRTRQKQKGFLHAFLHEYDLSSEEGIALMCLAEALLRIPDAATADKLISDRLATADWKAHKGSSDSLFVNAATWSLILTGKILAPSVSQQKSFALTLQKLLARSSTSIIRPIMMQGMKLIGKQFVMGTTIDEALARAKSLESKGYRYSYDMLGEAARTHEDAERYFTAYENAIEAIGNQSQQKGPIESPGISIKLSALHPRYEMAQRERVFAELMPRLEALVRTASEKNIGLTIDAEEADRLELSLEIIEKLAADPNTKHWEGLGLAVQAYQKRAPRVIDLLTHFAKQYQRKFMVRLIKGAYWDAEIKQSQLLGLSGYPVYTRKHATDVSYIACARQLLSQSTHFYPQFGTHNAYSVATILELTGNNNHFEFQCLHGMGQPLYDGLVPEKNCRIYAPVGTHKDLLGYLVRRLLENGANSSFVNLLADETIPLDKIVEDPVARINNLAHKPHPHIPLPQNLYGNDRLNSQGIDLSDTLTLDTLKKQMDETAKQTWQAGKNKSTTAEKIFSPADRSLHVGDVYQTTVDDIDGIFKNAMLVKKDWANQSTEQRAQCLEKAADLFQEKMPELMTLLSLEGGKSIVDCISEVRETIDFCRYYAARAREDLARRTLTGPTGELDELSLHPRGIIVCISPWNFPLAIFTGQIVAALVTGNCVIAKPAEQTPLIAQQAVNLLHAAGIPESVLQLACGRGETVGATLIADERIDGVMFTGGTDTAKIIQKTLANRSGPIVPFIAETGGQNAMIVDSSALPEQVVADVIQSSFNSAGQRCSALRVLFLQEDIAQRVIDMLVGAMQELRIGDPGLLSTDVGPVIDQASLDNLNQHVNQMRATAKCLYQIPVDHLSQGYFFGPCAFELDRLDILKREIFGPILHVIRYKARDLDQVIQEIIDTGYGLTFGIHSRIESTVKYVTDNMPVGNIYVNRNMIGATVGVQPFGGEGLSGTGPKAGGPFYLSRLCVERTISINTTAAGGNATLVSLGETDG
ncbi:MAG: bifunctional proline dehydrogenase/L-glutamate gamma-semialdehyde dehydrogenase PutA [Gammaproteobacteria bacterium]|nr:bifunctional proline dehydrogenase/L-glutamate gamma-semialdehyde dehydrogenase PutA [Gammaproteobacteria bacterium]